MSGNQASGCVYYTSTCSSDGVQHAGRDQTMSMTPEKTINGEGRCTVIRDCLVQWRGVTTTIDWCRVLSVSIVLWNISHQHLVRALEVD